jgi:cob(I)alamin adenosyltransferase
MKIYTKTGDDGTTGLFGGERVDKHDPRVEAYGVVGVARAASPPAEVEIVLARIQEDLFVLGAELACASGKEDRLKLELIGGDDIARLEHAIDRAEDSLPELRSFVLPAGSPAAAALHLARTVCRRAERRLNALSEHRPVRPELVIYLNRLSDLLFVLARRSNHSAGLGDSVWKPRAGS